MKLISQGAKVKILATILQGNPNAVTALKKTGLKSVADMKGKSVAMPNAGSQPSMFPLVLAANNLKESDIKLVNMPPQSMVASLIQGSVEVILGSVDQYDIQLKAQGQEFDSYLFIDSGAPTVSTSIIASDEFLAKNPDVAKKFVAASLKGWYATLDNPAEAVAAMKKMFPDANEKLAPAQIEATRFLMCVNRAKFVGKATPEQWADTVKIFDKIGVLPETFRRRAYYTYDYLPPESQLRVLPAEVAGSASCWSGLKRCIRSGRAASGWRSTASARCSVRTPTRPSKPCVRSRSTSSRASLSRSSARADAAKAP